MPQDSHFHIHGDARCLENLLTLNGDLTGTSFLSHLWDDKAFRNREFLKRQTFNTWIFIWICGILVDFGVLVYVKILGIIASLLEKLFDI